MSSSPPGSFLRSPLRSQEKVQSLTAGDLGVAPEIEPPPLPAPTPRADELPVPDLLPCEVNGDDEIVQTVQDLLRDGYAGVIFSGPPGTSKSWYAAQVAAILADRDPSRVRPLQFHPSYQYEDFVEGFIPVVRGGFELAPKHLLQMCQTASETDGKLCVLVIDELSRSDPGRVFGEALTYIEMTRRNQKFRLASGREVVIPANLVFLATMNPLDRGVDEVDAAFERRFAKIPMDPSPTILKKFLDASRMEPELQTRVVAFFQRVLNDDNPFCRIGHTYFRTVTNIESLNRLWRFQLRFHFEKAFRLDPEGRKQIEAAWRQVVPSISMTRQAEGS
jgi:5-methylcytosine-specific restriction enzyme B